MTRTFAFAAINPNDPAIVAMKTWHEPVDLYRYETAPDGERAFPTAARGNLNGVLVCGPKRGGEAYPPDESEALASVGQGLGSALDSLSDTGDADIRTMLKQILTNLG